MSTIFGDDGDDAEAEALLKRWQLPKKKKKEKPKAAP